MKINNFNKLLEKVTTPCIIYDSEIIKTIIGKIQNDYSQVKNVDLYFSIKANRYEGVLKILEKLMLGVDIASISEYEKINNIGFKKVSATSPSFTSNEIDLLYQNNIVPDFNSVSQLEQWCINRKVNISNIGLRLKMEIAAELKHDTISDETSRFGIDYHDCNLKRVIEAYQLKVTQIHIHLGEYRNAEILRNILIQLCKVLEQYPDIELINFGGGLTYIYAHPDEVKKFWNYIKLFSNDLLNVYNPKLRFIFEPGMLLMISSGFLLSTVLYIDKTNGNKNIVVLDCSAWNLYSWSPIRIKEQYPHRVCESYEYKIVGSSCYEYDIFLDNVFLTKLEIGDKILFEYSGAYVSSMMRNMHGFNYINEYII